MNGHYCPVCLAWHEGAVTILPTPTAAVWECAICYQKVVNGEPHTNHLAFGYGP